MCEQTTEQVTTMTYTGDNEAMQACFGDAVLFDAPGEHCGLQHYVSHHVGDIPRYRDLVVGMTLTQYEDGRILAL